MKQEIQVQERHQPDNDKVVDRVRSIVDSNKLQVELETLTPSGSPATPQTIPPPTPPLKSKLHSPVHTTKNMSGFITKTKLLSTAVDFFSKKSPIRNNRSPSPKVTRKLHRRINFELRI